MDATALANRWYDLFSRYADDLYPGRYTREKCLQLAEQGLEIQRLAAEKQSTIVAHNYLYPEFHELAEKVGDSLGLSFFVRDRQASRVDFESVYFMGATAKLITGDATRVFVPDRPEVLGCSLVFGTDHAWLEKWKATNPEGILITYVNSDAYTKSISDFVCTSRNTDKIIVHAVKTFPGRRILVLPDKFLGLVMKQRALETLSKQGISVDPDAIEVYTHTKGNWNACCYVHEKIGDRGVEMMMDEHPDAELMIHPECGCASSCLYKLHAGIIPQGKAYFLSTEAMVDHAQRSPQQKFIVATESGMVYRLRKECPQKTFLPVSSEATCSYMKANTLEKLLVSLRSDSLEITLCDDCCDPKRPYEDEHVIHIPRSTAEKARTGIERMLSVP
ncbi:MAG TPA: quinolinate synthase [Candidatus Acidoferrales bacterium]|nr:quinolinate synthase [Candidatus Acidoferrales bacterium]